MARRSAFWVVGIAGSAVGSVVTVFIAGLINPLLDPKALLDQFSSDPPIHVVSSLEFADHGWVFGVPLSDQQVAQYDDVSSSASSAEDYMESIGGWPRAYEGIALVLQSRRAKPIRILDLEPQVVGCRGVPTSTLVLTTPQGDDSDPHLGVDLDLPKPTFIDTSVAKGQSRSYFELHSMQVMPGEVLPVQIDSYAFAKACEWRIQADVQVDDKKESFVLDAPHPFRVSGGAPMYGKAYAAAALWPEALRSNGTHNYGPADLPTLCEADCRFPLAKTPF